MECVLRASHLMFVNIIKRFALVRNVLKDFLINFRLFMLVLVSLSVDKTRSIAHTQRMPVSAAVKKHVNVCVCVSSEVCV